MPKLQPSALARLTASVFLCLAAWTSVASAQEDPAQITIGERLFLETRFAEFFARNATDMNAPLPAGDPVVEETQTTGDPLPNPFAGQSMNCRSCHFVDEHLDVPGGGMRTYADFARRSPVPARTDGKLSAPRNSPALVNASLARPAGILLHFDAEFASLEDLVRGTLLGRNYGWLASERPDAVAHIARVIRGDDGSGELAQQFGGSYRVVLAGVDPSLPPELVLPPEFRLDVDQASDDEIVDAISRIIAAYVEALVFAQNDDGAFNGSPFDEFLRLNGLPGAPRPRESAKNYTERLRRALRSLKNPVFVNDGPFEFHDQDRVFGELELAGLRAFMEPGPKRILPKHFRSGGFGNCTACHLAPSFTDFGFHNTGTTQREYDGVHGSGGFAALSIPNLAARNADPDAFLPATPAHPNASEVFRAAADASDARLTDLGVWNVLANLDFPAPQAKLLGTLCLQEVERAGVKKLPLAERAQVVLKLCSPAALLERSIATFKTPGLRDLSHSAPYMHNGELDTLEDVVGFYRDVSVQARENRLRNAAPELRGIVLRDSDEQAIAAFLRALNEDYN